ncbi:YrdB family protein [Streptomyces sp. Y2F8-2]|uniref:YrdB family protein n=1 Tax=Streptomyces sp. Y2F8-2 TaxID=2759675 RepID=UPI0027E587D2|nr:YrdB family protein [Streptomyces sp. Y2F8-2]
MGFDSLLRDALRACHAVLPPSPGEDFMPGEDDSITLVDGWPWYAANELLAFLLELAATACLSWWGFTVGPDGAGRVLLGVGTPLSAIVLWSLFAAPKARWRPRLPLVLVVKTVVLGGGAAAVYGVGHHVAAVTMAVVVIANTAVAEAFRRTLVALPAGQAPVTRSPESR